MYTCDNIVFHVIVSILDIYQCDRNYITNWADVFRGITLNILGKYINRNTDSLFTSDDSKKILVYFCTEKSFM
jgi:hypothetical protein